MNEMTSMRPQIGPTTHFINGRWSKPGGRTFADYNPFNDDVVAEVAAGGRDEAVAAVLGRK